ncbi:AAA family ATPase [Pseudonocardia adelaidensis]|uniref:AAA family ATPase n=1 Tax=Pseudonocardia adelaidensis TaxID=648754 RepID=UPI0031E7B951
MTTATPPVRLALPGRTLLLVAGMPGAGKSTLLASLPAAAGLTVLDSEAQRAALRPVAGGVPYAWQRPVVHLMHRTAVVGAAVSATPTVVVHLPATQPRTRAAMARLAAATGRDAHLLWLQADAAEARRGQYARGRVVQEHSFCAHARRAERTAAELLGDPPPGWRSVTVVDRAAASGGLRLVTDPEPARGAGTAAGSRDHARA